MNKYEESLTRQQLQKKIKTLFDEIKRNYFQLLQSLKFQNYQDKRKFKDTGRKNKAIKINDEDDEQEEVKKLDLQKKYYFEDQMAQQNKGRIAGLKIIQNIKELNDLNSNILLYQLENRQQDQLSETRQVAEKLRHFQFSLCNLFHDSYR